MNYIIYDLEFNQKHPNIIEVEGNNDSNLRFEIIQIGALKLNESFETISTFNSLIKPTVHTTIHPYVENLTKINDDKISLCKSFPDVYDDFIRFIGDDETVLCVWGIVDVKELMRNIKFHNLSTLSISKYYIDIQKYASKYFKVPKGCRIGLKNAIEFLNISTEGEFHDAFNDAYYTTEVFKSIHNDHMKPEIYSPSPSRRVEQPKEKIDIVALINQFERMYGREMSLEEQSLIKLAYIMGKTKQFIL
ncbi:3'-5' exonuclease [Clostridium uliginosum]|uniref:Inhibitor of the KinA pathway to sporulation, predicted exonuclease n=1 Tax=Clostridium uliginosum TaxID=119641 RepID=A0A1I1QGF6_9CLOT|nr:3'-5' exonuclease [Clostridium uliginosum]SFD17200.1 Inhibitor of the KinA pathway to sporulation, predicted exonuclease [Clostridium uliginosum]